MPNLDPDTDFAIDLLMQLLAIPGLSTQEKAIVDFITARLRKAGVPASAITADNAHKKSKHGGQVGNLIVKLPGRGTLARAPRRMFMAHVDTVPVCVGARPVRKGNWIHARDAHTGLGADNRTGVATVLATALHLLEQKPDHPPITLLFTIQEEIGLYGARYIDLKKLGKPEFAFNFDGGNPAKLTIGATGAYRASIEIHGKASHAGVAPQEGISAITIAALAIADLHKHGWLGRVSKKAGRGTANVGVINAGHATNVITPLALVRAEMRSHDRRFRRVILDAHREAFERAAATMGGTIKFDAQLDYESFSLKETDPVVALAEQAIRDAGGHPITSVTDGGVDANYINTFGIPTVTLGAGQEHAHMTSERVNLPAFINAQRVTLRLATR